MCACSMVSRDTIPASPSEKLSDPLPYGRSTLPRHGPNGRLRKRVPASPSPRHRAQARAHRGIDKFKGQFDMGWDRYREMTFERQKQLGVVQANAVPTPCPTSLPTWDSIPAEHRRLFARIMEIFAGYGAHVDYEMGRVIEAVKEAPRRQHHDHLHRRRQRLVTAKMPAFASTMLRVFSIH